MKKRAIPDSHPPTRDHMTAIKENVETITGRRGVKCDLDGLRNMVVSDPPTQGQVEFLRAQLVRLIERLEG